ncbi:MAG: proline--tRNA ligase [bacterium]
MAEEKFVSEITPQSKDFSQWFIDCLKKAEVVDYAPVKGCMVIRPYGYAIWERMKSMLDARIKALGCQNAYFPLFIPESFLKKEAEHVAGFAPQVAWVTKGGNEELEEPLAVRPTSEAIICYMFSRWIQSYRDLPLLINQWANVVRWEMVTRPFIRTTEFLWQEGHTVHATYEEAEEFALKALNMYVDFYEKDLGVPVIYGQKTEREKFAGALTTYTIEPLMPDGRALQGGTSHNLGQHFAKVFDIKYLNEEQKEVYAWQTSWGISTRAVGALIMTHGDDSGLILPPSVAPHQVIIVPIIFEKTREETVAKAREIRDVISKAGVRVYFDERLEYTAGWKFSEWEMRGVPLRVEIGPKDIEKGVLTVVRRSSRQKEIIKIVDISRYLKKTLKSVQSELYEMAKKYLKSHITYTDNYEEFKKLMDERAGFVLAGWCGDSKCEEAIQEETKATVRVIPMEELEMKAKVCVKCGRKSKETVYYARAY